ncbi:hypothetical protein KIPB_014795, partial [Kipferlia bialata]|eukprot:g14795.t1
MSSSNVYFPVSHSVVGSVRPRDGVCGVTDTPSLQSPNDMWLCRESPERSAEAAPITDSVSHSASSLSRPTPIDVSFECSEGVEGAEGDSPSPPSCADQTDIHETVSFYQGFIQSMQEELTQ